MNSVSVKNVGMKFSERMVLSGVDLEVAPGTVLACLGPNGAGKTTLLKILTGELTPSVGNVFYDGHDLQGKMGRGYLKRLGYLPERAALYEFLTGLEYLAFMARIYDLDRSRKKWVEEQLRRLNMEEAGPSLSRTYSQGMRKKIALLAAFLTMPDLVLLDEPTANLDAEAVPVISDLIREVSDRGGAVIFTTHDLEFAKVMATDGLVLREGRVVAQGGWVTVAATLNLTGRTVQSEDAEVSQVIVTK